MPVGCVWPFVQTKEKNKRKKIEKKNMVPKLKRKESQYAVVTTGSYLYRKVINICLKMPKRYTYLILKDIIDLANKVTDYTRGAKSFLPLSVKLAQIQMAYFLHATAANDALSGKINHFLLIPEALTYKDLLNKKTKGITDILLEEVADLIDKERELIEKLMEKTRKDFPDLVLKKVLKETFLSDIK